MKAKDDMPNLARGVSEDEKKGVDDGPCKSFEAQDDNPVRCRWCGYLRASHR
jgi:hypothetical protein